MSDPTTPQLFPSWTWVTNEIGMGYWEAPVPHPTENGTYRWDESTLSWIKVD